MVGQAGLPVEGSRGRRREDVVETRREARLGTTTHLYALSCMPVRTSHACTGPSELLPVRTTSSRKFVTAAIASVESSSGHASGLF